MRLLSPVLFQLTASIDEGGAQGLLLNHLATRNDGALVFDSQDTLTGASTIESAAGDGDATLQACQQLLSRSTFSCFSTYASVVKCQRTHNNFDACPTPMPCSSNGCQLCGRSDRVPGMTSLAAERVTFFALLTHHFISHDLSFSPGLPQPHKLLVHGLESFN